MNREIEPIVLTRVIDADTASLYRAWTDPLLMRHWLAEPPYKVEQAFTAAHVGGVYRILVSGVDGREYALGGEYLALLPGRSLAMSWNYRSPFAPSSDTPQQVSVGFAALAPRRTRLDLRHDGIVDDGARERMSRAWAVLLEKLDAMYV
jgi:uncharacterized protein YndB with AHSA1/START domain